MLISSAWSALPIGTPVLTQAFSPSAPHLSATTVARDQRVSRMAADGLAWTPALMDAPFVSRLHIRVNDGGDARR